jgi:hypothetical protein
MKLLRQPYFLIVILLLVSCEKESEVDKILYTDIQPNKSLTTFGDIGLGQNNIVAMSNNRINDTIFSFALSKTSLDLNKDGVEDYIIEIKHELIDSARSVYNDKFIIQINSWASNLISLSDRDLGYIKKYENEQQIDTTTFSVNSRYSLNTPGGFIINNEGDENFQLLGDYYVAIKLNVDNNIFFGWIHIKVDFFNLILCEYAISKEPGKLIKIGQKK